MIEHWQLLKLEFLGLSVPAMVKKNFCCCFVFCCCFSHIFFTKVYGECLFDCSSCNYEFENCLEKMMAHLLNKTSVKCNYILTMRYVYKARIFDGNLR